MTEPVPTPDSADDATVGERKPATDRRVCPSCGGIAAVVWKSNPLRFWSHGHCVNVLVPATPPADDANRAPVSGGLDEGERSWGITRSNGATVYAEHDVERILATRDAAWVERLAAVEGERDDWKATAWGNADLVAGLVARAETDEAERDTARREAGEAGAKALRDAADAIGRSHVEVALGGSDYVRQWLRARADALTSDDGSGA